MGPHEIIPWHLFLTIQRRLFAVAVSRGYDTWFAVRLVMDYSWTIIYPWWTATFAMQMLYTWVESLLLHKLLPSSGESLVERAGLTESGLSSSISCWISVTTQTTTLILVSLRGHFPAQGLVSLRADYWERTFRLNLLLNLHYYRLP